MMGNLIRDPRTSKDHRGDWPETMELLTLSLVYIRPRRRAGTKNQGPRTDHNGLLGHGCRMPQIKSISYSQDVYPKGDVETEAVASDDNRMPNRRMEAIGSVFCTLAFSMYPSCTWTVLRAESLHFTAHWTDINSETCKKLWTVRFTRLQVRLGWTA
ncbi:hypothetical protein CDEST_07337 [Colletotrichum destructivum]|uniref:Uncharacterized protein n=1 Tax=Colletotrichum destructivum TaxID=34406 RepID=A0AAX4IFT1_9PEZI|nr:hypothetical protein CDEST_07337 [Colletotrichum destructivum]